MAYESSPLLDTLAREFKHFAEHEAQGASPLYAHLCGTIAHDPELLALAAVATSRPVPNLLFAAVQYLLRREPRHPLRVFYPTLGGTAPATDDPAPHFRAFCLEHADAIRHILATRRVQTNEVRRCALLVPAFAHVSDTAPERPLALVEIGASAGFNLLWDRYAYDYGSGRRYGSPDAVVRLTCELRGDLQPPLPVDLPPVASRLGIDLQPIDVGDPDAVDWLRGLIWPEHLDRLALLDQAVVVMRDVHPPVRTGDALDVLEGELARLSVDVLPCVYHTFTVNQFSPTARSRLNGLLDAFGATRDLACVSIGYGDTPVPELRLLTYIQGTKHERLLAYCHPHGLWLDWQDIVSSSGNAGRGRGKRI